MSLRLERLLFAGMAIRISIEFSEDEAKKVLSEDEIKVNVALNIGSESASAWGCDLTYDYVKINGDYRS